MSVTPLEAILVFVGGLALGGVFFGGLWLTVRRLAGSRRPALLAFGSFIARTIVAAGGFYLLIGGEWLRAVIVLAGFIASRMLLIHRVGRAGKTLTPGEEIRKHGS